VLTTSKVFAQSQSYNRANNEINFNHDLSRQWALELDVGQSWTSVPGQEPVLSDLSQLYTELWAHYGLNDKWKLSFAYAYYFNKYVPEISQRATPEWRSTIQAIYYIERRRFIISTRWRIEDRHIKNTDSVFEAVERLRGQIKAVYPFNGQSIGKRIFYGVASEELIFKTPSKISGPELFDRNKISAGIGYGINDNFQIELIYINQYLPRDISKIYNGLQLNVVFNNFLPRLTREIFGKKPGDAATGN
jgi:hypothetical protein